MASKFLAKLILVVGIILLAHSAYSTYEFRKDLKLSNKPYTHIPYDIVIETVVSLIICFAAGALLSGRLRPIKVTQIAALKSWDTVNQRPNFATGNHRLPPQ